MSKLLLIDSNPYIFASGERQADGNFDNDIRYHSYSRYKFDFPQELRFEIKDKNKTNINIGSVSNVRMSDPMLKITMSWDAMLEEQKDVLNTILDSKRLISRISFNSGVDYITGEIIPVFKKSELLGYVRGNLGSTSFSFTTQLVENLMRKLF